MTIKEKEYILKTSNYFKNEYKYLDKRRATIIVSPVLKIEGSTGSKLALIATFLCAIVLISCLFL